MSTTPLTAASIRAHQGDLKLCVSCVHFLWMHGDITDNIFSEGPQWKSSNSSGYHLCIMRNLWCLCLCLLIFTQSAALRSSLGSFYWSVLIHCNLVSGVVFHGRRFIILFIPIMASHRGDPLSQSNLRNPPAKRSVTSYPPSGHWFMQEPNLPGKNSLWISVGWSLLPSWPFELLKSRSRFAPWKGHLKAAPKKVHPEEPDVNFQHHLL